MLVLPDLPKGAGMESGKILSLDGCRIQGGKGANSDD